MRSLNASQTSLYGCLSYLCSFTIKMHSYLYSSALRCSEIYKKCKKYKKKAKGTRLFTGPGCYGSAYREHNRWESLWVIALVALGNAKREGHRAGPKHAHLCSVFRFRGRLSCVCADTGIFTLAKQGSCIDLCDCDEFGIVIWIYWLMWPSEYGPASLSASQPPNSHSQLTCAPRIMVILNAISKMLLRAFTYKSFVILPKWMFLWQQVNAQYTINAGNPLIQDRKHI